MSATVETIIIVRGTLMRPCWRKGVRHRNMYSTDWVTRIFRSPCRFTST